MKVHELVELIPLLEKYVDDIRVSITPSRVSAADLRALRADVERMGFMAFFNSSPLADTELVITEKKNVGS